MLTGAAIIARKGACALVQLKTDVETVEETEEKQKHYCFTLIEFETAHTEHLETRINAHLESWITAAREALKTQEAEQTEEEKLEEVKQTTDELVELMADVLGGAI